MSHFFKTCIIAVFFCLSAVAAPAKDSIFVKNLGGTELEIRPDKIENSNLTFFRTKDGKKFTLPMNSFDESSQTKANDWFKNGLHLSTKYEISVSSGRTARDNGQQNYDDTAVNLAPEVIVTMGGLDSTRPCRVSAFFFGRSINNRNAIFLFTNDSREVPTLKKGKEAVMKLKGGNWNYDDEEPVLFGARYLGYVVIIDDPKTGEVYQVKSVPSSLTKYNTTEYLKLKPGQFYHDETLQMFRGLD